MPHRAPGSCIKSEYIIRGGDEHNSADDNRRDFQILRVAGMEKPRRAQLRNIPSVDFAQTAIAASTVVAIVGSPVLTNRLREQIFGFYIDISCDWRTGLLGRRG